MRKLTREEISLLEDRGSRAENWGLIGVAEGFCPGDSFRRVFFAGRVELGRLAPTPNGDPDRAPGIDDAFLRDASIGDNCRIRRARLVGVRLGDDVLIEDVEELARIGNGPFLPLPRADALAEDGARSVPLWRGLSAQLAHILCHLKGLPPAEALEAAILRESGLDSAGSLPLIGSGCRMVRCGRLINVRAGDSAVFSGVSRMENCWLESSPDAPALVGEGSIIRHSAILAGSEIRDRVTLSHCLVGEGVRLEDGFSAEHSLFFANSHFARGEALAALAGPFAVSHHKATLVLSCQCLFNNFGSGSNASNHHFKLGPRHGGILRRGTNCGSGSYIFWPSDIGAFTTVIGRHSRHLDTVAFPFSLLLAEGGESVLIPGANLFSAGGLRDAGKWRERERRKNPDRRLDLVNPAIFSPYVFQEMDRGAAILRRAEPGDVAHGGAIIPAARRIPALELYAAALVFHLGERLLAMARASGAGGAPELEDLVRLFSRGSGGEGDGGGDDWSDWAGMLIPGRAARAFLAGVAEGRLASPEASRKRLGEIHADYDRLEAEWVVRRWRREYGCPDPDGLARFFGEWRKAARYRRDRLLRDIAKEFAAEAALGFGVETPAGESFARLRGGAEEHPLTMAVHEECRSLLAEAGNLGNP
ncbi:MAG: DUF4954 family protein [Planctomycetota bacterium]|jgi:hypothetical protein|nr:DUF4954 family protein [Planctomycetota bacterium]